MRQMSVKELKVYLEQQAQLNPLLLDVREPWEYHMCRIENSTLIPMRQIPQAVEELNPEQETIVICHHGVRSRRVGQYLIQSGFKNVINLEGGIDAWARQIDPQMTTY